VTHGLYRVSGKREFRGHRRGETFIARIEPTIEGRLRALGHIELIERVTPALAPGTYRLPPGWTESSTHQPEAPRGASLIEGGT
jgi:hypothetical protein